MDKRGFIPGIHQLAVATLTKTPDQVWIKTEPGPAPTEKDSFEAMKFWEGVEDLLREQAS